MGRKANPDKLLRLNNWCQELNYKYKRCGTHFDIYKNKKLLNTCNGFKNTFNYLKWRKYFERISKEVS